MAALVAAAPTGAQESRAPTLASCEDRRPLGAIWQTLAVNLVINRTNAWLFGWEFGHVGFESWSRNLQRGWKWDGTQFAVNMFAHPYHGSLYHGAARANCLNYWESIPVVFLGSWTWEYLGETHRASLNDFYMTGFSGPALGEILYRASWLVLDEEAEGLGRFGRELAALIINPVGGLNRLARGQWFRQGTNPVDRIPEAYSVSVKVGGRQVEETLPGRPPQRSPTLLVDVTMGDVFETEPRAPFDVVEFRAQISRDGSGLNLLRTLGRLYGNELTSPDSWHRHQLVINQRFDYVNNPVYNFGEQGLELGIRSRWRAGSGLRLNTRLAANAIVLGAVEALEAGQPQRRTIDWGPGFGAIAEIALEYNGTTYLSFYNRVRYLTSVSGAPADHTLLFSGFEFTIPITRGLGLGAYVSGDRRESDYANLPGSDLTDVVRSYTETRIFVTWTLGGGTSAPER